MAGTEEGAESAPAVWDPTARDGAGGWVRRRDPATAAMGRRPDQDEAANPPSGPGSTESGPQGRAGDGAGDTSAAADPTQVLPPVPSGPDQPPQGKGASAQEVDTPLGRPYVQTVKDIPRLPSAPPPSPTQSYPQPSGPVPPPPSAPPRPGGGQYGYPPYGPPPAAAPSPGAPTYGGGGYSGGTYGAPAFGPPPGAGGPQPHQGQPYPGQPHQGRPYPGQPQAGQPYQGQQYQGQGQPYGGQPPYQVPAPVQGQGFAGPGGDTDPYGNGPSRRPNLPLLIAVVVVVAALVGVGAVWGLGLGRTTSTAGHGSSATPPPSAGSTTAPTASASVGASASAGAGPSASSTNGAAQTQATAVDQLLGQAANSRQKVVNAVAAVDQCSDSQSVSSAQSALTQAAQDRQSLVTRARALDVSQITGGAAALQTIEQAWTASAAADTAYANWAGAMAAGGCTPNNAPHNADWNNGTAQSGKASTDKNAFVVSWTPIATQYGLQTRTADAF